MGREDKSGACRPRPIRLLREGCRSGKLHASSPLLTGTHACTPSWYWLGIGTSANVKFRSLSDRLRTNSSATETSQLQQQGDTGFASSVNPVLCCMLRVYLIVLSRARKVEELILKRCLPYPGILSLNANDSSRILFSPVQVHISPLKLIRSCRRVLPDQVDGLARVNPSLERVSLILGASNII